MLTQQSLKELLDYNPETGIFAWKVKRRGTKRISPAGTIVPGGYRYICINQRYYLAHRLAWLYVYGELPKDQIDHINRDRSDNSISNLRQCTSAQNGQNRSSKKTSTSKFVGVSWHSRSKKWRAKIAIGGIKKELGDFATEEEAYAAYCEAKKHLHTFSPAL